MIAQGSVTVTTIWTNGNNTTCKSIISIINENNPNPPVGSGRIEITCNVNLRDGSFDISTIEQTVWDGNKSQTDIRNSLSYLLITSLPLCSI